MYQLFSVFVLTALLWHEFTNVSAIDEIFSLASSSSCTNRQYFDVDSFKCVACAPGYIKASDGFSCICGGTHRLVTTLGSTSQEQCVSCKLTEYVSYDRTTCVPRNCFTDAKKKTSCTVCKKNQIIVTHSINSSQLNVVECVSCAPGSLPSQDRTFCQRCTIRTAGSPVKTCECDSKVYSLIDNICIPNTFSKNMTIYKVKSRSGEIYESSFFERNWISASYLCSLQNTTACNIMANMCVMSLYEDGENSPCSKWRHQKATATPAIMYGEDESYSVLIRKKIPVVFSLNEKSENHHLDIVSTSITPEGLKREAVNLESTWISACPTVWKSFQNNIFKFAVNYRHRCKIGSQQLINTTETMFFEPYLKYSDKDSKTADNLLHAIPILIKSDLIHFNKESDINTWQLVRRFYIFDKTSGIVGTDDKQELKYFRYAKHISVRVRIRLKGKDERSKIFPPLIVVEYAELSDRDISDNVDVYMDLRVNYELDGAGLFHGIEIAVGTISAFATLYSILQCWSHSRRSGKLGFDLFTMIQFLILVSGNLANTFFIVSFGASVYSFMMFKTQKAVYIMPPSDKDESVIQSYIIIAFSLKIIELLAVNWRQITTDIFFIDWERPSQTMDELGIKTSNQQGDTLVTFWRPYFVANEWNEIQTLRKISLPIHLVFCIFVLEVFGASSWAVIGVEVIADQSTGPLTSTAYQLAVGGIIFLILYYSQLMIALFVYERYIKNAIQDFMDVCSIANVSLLIMDSPLHGYYLHGRCVHASCDTDARGLQAGLPFRAFVVRCTSEFRLYYSRLSVHLASRDVKWQWQHHLASGKDLMDVNASVLTDMQASRRSVKMSGRGEQGPQPSAVLPPELQRRQQASQLINKFLTAFFDHALEDLDYEVREKRLVERLLDIELINDSSNRTLLLYNASGDPQSFQRIIWYGQEWTLATFDLFLFCFVQMMSGSYTLAALVTAVVWKVLSIIRQYGGQKNLAKKTLVDERFLI